MGMEGKGEWGCCYDEGRREGEIRNIHPFLEPHFFALCKKNAYNFLVDSNL